MSERHPSRSPSRWWWGAVTLAAVLTLTLGPWGFWLYLAGHGGEPTAPEVVYRTLKMFVLNCDSLTAPVPWQLEAARFLAAFAGFSTVALALLQLFRQRLQLVRLRFYRDHIVVCGLGPFGAALVEALRLRGERVVVLERDESQEGVAACRQSGAVVLTWPDADPDLLRQAGLGRARLLLALFADDAVNLRMAMLARGVMAPEGGRLKCVIQVASRDLRSFILQEDLLGRAEDPFRLELFNGHEAMAQAMLDHAATLRRGKGPARLLLVGLGQLGEALLVRAARGWQIDGDAEPRRQVLVLDRDADRLVARLTSLYPSVASVCTLEPHALDVQSPQLSRSDFLRADGAAPVDIAFICLPDESLQMVAAVRLAELLGGGRVPIILRLASSAGLPALLRGRHAGAVRALGQREVLTSPALVEDATREALARASHEHYLRAEAALGLTSADKPSLVSWEELPEHFRESNRAQAAHIPVKLRAIGYRLVPAGDELPPFTLRPEQREYLARMEHERWCEEKRRAGWQYGPVRDDARKLHPALVPWEQLGKEDQDRDRRAVDLLPSLAARAGYVIVADSPSGNGAQL